MNALVDTKPVTVVETPTKKVPSGPFWLTRDKRDGILSTKVEVWLVQPELHRYEDGDVMWLPPLEIVDDGPSNFGEWSIEKCLKECRTYPETERECIVHY